MKKSLTTNIPLKIMSVIAAILIWLIIVNVDNPIVTRTIPNVPVQVLNEAYIESGGMMCLIPEDQDRVSVTVRGTRKTVESLKASDITATADLKQVVDLSTDPVMVPIAVNCPGIDANNAQSVPRNMEIQIEEMMTQEFIVTVDTDGTQPGKGYEIGSLESNPEKIRITGPQSLIEKIDRVVATVDVEGITSDTTEQAELTIIDRNQEELTENQMKYLKYDILSPEVSVTVDLWKVKSNVQIEASYVGTPADGYKVDKLSLTPSEISVAGSDEALSQLEAQGNTIQISADQVDVSGKKEDFDTRVNLTDFLPTGIELTTGTSETLIIRAEILPMDSRSYTISTKDITVENAPSDLEVVFETDRIEIRVQENGSSLDELDIKDIEASIDLTGKEAGSYQIPVEITLPEGYSLVSTVHADVKLSETTEVTTE
ncbi:MAG TPA: hypothetical protein IAA11_02955 [Candidatus Blautia intestinigallinarum]|nr:hypothetical protein [Candidatus Blautia intestinigallinarum]